jgi:chromate transporter
LVEVAWVFFRLGTTAFGGPAAHVAMMEREIVGRRKWLSSERFLDLFGAANLLPGPSSSELALFLGYERAGWLGLLVAGTCFVLPAATITLAIAWFYVRFGTLPRIEGVFFGIKPVIVAIILQAVISLAPKAIKSRALVGIGLASLAACLASIEPVYVLIGAGIASALLLQPRWMSSAKTTFFSTSIALAGLALPITVAVPAVRNTSLLLIFAKIGAMVFGSGYVLLAYLRADFVVRLHWLTESQLLDAVTVGQMTPGPVFTTATFIGYLLGGFSGAVLATIGIFLPGFVLTALVWRYVARMRKSKVLGRFLDGVNAASLSLIVMVTWHLARTSLVAPIAIAIGLVSLILLLVARVSSVWLLAVAALVGALVH